MLEKLVKDGKVKHIGVSNFSLKELKEACTSTSLEIASIQVEYNLFDRSIEQNLLPFCRERKISVIGYSPLIQGRLVNGIQQKEILKNIEVFKDKSNKVNHQGGHLWLEFDETFIEVETSDGVKLHNTIEATHFFNTTTMRVRFPLTARFF